MIKLQLALDMLTPGHALRTAAQAAPFIDILEIGTPLIKHAGIEMVRLLRAVHPDKELLVDLKTMDAGEYEASPFLDAGANYVTVLGAADDRTIAGVVKAASARGAKAVVDIINDPRPEERAAAVWKLGAGYVGVHSGIDQQLAGHRPLETLARVRRATDAKLCVAGGINAETIGALAQEGPEIIVVGGAITGAADPAAAAARVREALNAAVQSAR